MTRITEQIDRLQRRIGAATQAAGRSPDSVTVVAVSKYHSAAAVAEAQAAGLTNFGENYLAEALVKIEAITNRPNWHFIGQIQSNKTRAIAEQFDWVQTVCEARICRRLAEQRPVSLPPLQICIQLKPAGGTDRRGATEDEVMKLADLAGDFERVRLRGLMMMPLPGLDQAGQRAEFARTRRLSERLGAAGHPIDTLSMGMSADLETAIIEGSTMVRIGTGIFGPRKQEATQ